MYTTCSLFSLYYYTNYTFCKITTPFYFSSILKIFLLAVTGTRRSRNSSIENFVELKGKATHITGEAVVPWIGWLRGWLLLMMDTAHPSSWVWIVDVFRHHADPMGQSTASGGGWARASGTGAGCTSTTASTSTSAASSAPATFLAALRPRERGFLQGRKATRLIGDRSIQRIKRSSSCKPGRDFLLLVAWLV